LLCRRLLCMFTRVRDTLLVAADPALWAAYLFFSRYMFFAQCYRFSWTSYSVCEVTYVSCNNHCYPLITSSSDHHHHHQLYYRRHLYQRHRAYSLYRKIFEETIGRLLWVIRYENESQILLTINSTQPLRIAYFRTVHWRQQGKRLEPLNVYLHHVDWGGWDASREFVLLVDTRAIDLVNYEVENNVCGIYLV